MNAPVLITREPLDGRLLRDMSGGEMEDFPNSLLYYVKGYNPEGIVVGNEKERYLVYFNGKDWKVHGFNVPHFVDLTLVADTAARDGDLPVLMYLADTGISLAYQTAQMAALTRQIHVLDWLSQLNPPVLPSFQAAGTALFMNHPEVLRWLVERSIFPSESSVQLALSKGNHDLVNWLRDYRRIHQV